MNVKNTLRITVLLTSVCFVSPLFADSIQVNYGQGTYERVSSHSESMANSTLAADGYFDSWLENPAMISRSGFGLLLPSLTLSIHQPSTLFADEDNNGKYDLSEAYGSSGSERKNAIDEVISPLFDGTSSDILTAQTTLGIKGRNLATAFELQQKLYTDAFFSQGSQSDLFGVTTAVGTMGYGFYLIPDFMQVGVSARAIYTIVSTGISYDTVLDYVSDNNHDDIEERTLMGTPVAYGYAFPFSIGANVMPFSGFTVSAVANNIHGKYTYKLADSYQTVYDEWTPDDTMFAEDSSYYHRSISSNEITYTPDIGLDLGASWDLTSVYKDLHPLFTLEVEDVLGYTYDEDEGLIQKETDYYSAENIMKRITLGAQIEVLKVIQLRGGVAENYWSAGGGIDVFSLLHLDVAYTSDGRYEEYGIDPEDSLTVKFSLISK